MGMTVVSLSLVGTGLWLGWWLNKHPFPKHPSLGDRIACYRPVVDIFHGVATSTADDSLSPTGLSRYGKRGSGGIQGLGWLPPEQGGDHTLYVGHTHAIRKVQLDPEDWHVVQFSEQRIYNQTTEFPSIRLPDGQEHPIVHFGGITVIFTAERGTEVLFAAHTALDAHEVGGGAVVGVRADTLEAHNGTVAARNPHAANDWVAVDHATGIGYTGAFYNVTLALRFDLRTLEDLEPLNFTGSGLSKQGINFIQSATVQGSTLLLGTDDFQGSLYQVDLESGRVRGRQSLLLGKEMDGVVSVGPDHILVGYNRWESREGGSLQSVVLFEATHEWIEPDATVACGGSYARFLD